MIDGSKKSITIVICTIYYEGMKGIKEVPFYVKKV